MCTMYVRDAEGYLALSQDEVIREALNMARCRLRAGDQQLKNNRELVDFLTLKLAPLDYEVFGCVYLDVHLRVLAMVDLFRGTIDETAVHIREVAKEVLRYGAKSVVAYHNHPSMECEPSNLDIGITEKLRKALSLFDVRLIDHLIVGKRVYSFAEHGLL